MLGVKLRSEKVDQFDALGERGQPVYLVAPQILAIFKRWNTRHPGKYPDFSKSFAVPKANDDGSRIDWYAPEPGEVIAWSAATPEEQSDARARLEEISQAIPNMQMQAGASGQGTGGDSELFRNLLKWVVHHPDDSYVFLVNKIPVITFWGFVHTGADRNLSPLHSLIPAAAMTPAAAPLAPVAAPLQEAAPVAAAPIVATPWWRRWLFWLLLALLLLALLFGLRACAPKLGLPPLGIPWLDGTPPKVEVPAQTLPDLTPPKLPQVSLPTGQLPQVNLSPTNLPTTSLPSGGALPAGLPAVPGQALPDGGAAAGTGAGAEPPTSAPPATADAAGNTPTVPGNENAAVAPTPAASLTPPTLPDDKAPPQLTPPTLSETTPQPGQPAPSAAQSVPGTPLAIPANSKDGTADFLNGNWLAGAGIQDRNTGAPLRLQYEFNKGQGQVKLSRHDGVQCAAPVNAQMQGGSMGISNSGQAACSDGSVYELPNVVCAPNARNAADCMGNYGDQRFPMTMRQANP